MSHAQKRHKQTPKSFELIEDCSFDLMPSDTYVELVAGEV